MACLAVLTLVACTGDPAPVGTLPDSSPTSLTASPTITEPVRPIDKATPESAIQFTRYFWDLYNYAYQTYDTAPLKAISDPACKYCSSTIDDVKRISDAQTKIEGHTVALVEAASPPQKITSGTVVVANSDQSPGKAVSPSGEAIMLKGSRDKRFTFALAWRTDHWVIEGVDYDQKSGKPWVG